ncbi:M1 family metallopeptidase [Lysinibacillus sp. NPDC097287]|uniref:M1 family metallopeptidase n=1 Tax=Lysinibacillus sp. NPDC097287 TaxID=3364144 RepID=UPI0038147C71
MIITSIWIMGKGDNEKMLNPEMTLQDKEDFLPRAIEAGSKAKYAIDLEMDEQDNFNIHSKAYIQNDSTDPWGELVFYFMPNIFTETQSPQLKKSAFVEIDSIKVDEETAEYSLDGDTLSIMLKKEKLPKEVIAVDIKYKFTLPEKGFRFSKSRGNYILAQWYPMIATYRNHQWNKEDYRVKGETYHTSFSDYEITYKLPEGLTIISSGEDTLPSKQSGVLTAENIKEFYIALLKEPNIVEKQVNDINLRIIGVDDRTALLNETLDVAGEALTYFQSSIGPYPHKQLDIILDETGMEYPGVVTVGASDHRLSLPSTITHEIAHQWFYGLVNNDPYHDAWLDEGITAFATNLFIVHQKDKGINVKGDYHKDFLLPVNLSLDKYKLEEQSRYIYGKSSEMLWNLFVGKGGKNRRRIF